MVFSLGVTTTVGMTQDWALGHSRPWGLILTKSCPAASSLTRQAQLPGGGGSKWRGHVVSGRVNSRAPAPQWNQLKTN